MLAADETNARTAALESQSPNDEIGAVHKFDVVLAVSIPGRAGKQC